MKNKYFEDPFLKILPILDLHGETSDTIKVLIDDFVNYNYKIGKSKMAIIHGRHGKVLKTRSHEILKKNELVKNFHIYSENDGITIIECVISK